MLLCNRVTQCYSVTLLLSLLSVTLTLQQWFPYKICVRVYLNCQTFLFCCAVSSFLTNLNSLTFDPNPNSVLSECARLVFKNCYFSQGKTIILLITDQKVLTKKFRLDFI